MRRKKAVFFDLDDTLYPCEPVYDEGLRQAWRAWSSRRPAPWPAFRSLYARARARVKAPLRGSPSCHNRILYFKAMTELAFGRPLPRLALRMNAAYDRVWPRRLAGRALAAALAPLRGRYALGVVSNQVCLTQLRKLACLDPAGKLFDFVVTSEEAGREKPDPAIFREACRRAGCRPSEAYMVGDDWKEDVLGARRAGLTPVFFSPRGARPPASVLSIRRLEELSALLP